MSRWEAEVDLIQRLQLVLVEKIRQVDASDLRTIREYIELIRELRVYVELVKASGGTTPA